MTRFETELLIEIDRIRKIFVAQDCGDLDVRIRARGRSHNDLKITFSVDSLYGTEVEGSSLDACVEEFFRRQGWKKANDYLALSNLMSPEDRKICEEETISGQNSQDDEIPF